MKINASDVIERMKTALSVDTDKALADKLEVSNKTISSWRSRNLIPLNFILETSHQSNEYPGADYILFGLSRANIKPNFDFCDLTLRDFHLAGHAALISFLDDFDEEALLFMDDEELKERGENLGTSIFACIQNVLQSRRALLDTGKLNGAEFDEYIRQKNRLDMTSLITVIKRRDRQRDKQAPK